MLTPDDNSGHGGKIDYLNQPGGWRANDPDLFGHLAAALKGGGARHVGMVEDNNLIPGARYYSDILEDGVAAREAYMKTMLERFQGLDLVFFDPDSCLQVKSVQPGWKRFSKYLTCKNAEANFATGASLLIYQHYPFLKRDAYARVQVKRLADATGAKEIIPISTPHVLFLLVLHPRHVAAAQRALRAVENGWPGQIWQVDSGLGDH